jgi:hypothetical protein
MIAIFGARGVGKTTTLFQYLLELQDKKKNVLYISLNYPFFVVADEITQGKGNKIPLWLFGFVY